MKKFAFSLLAFVLSVIAVCQSVAPPPISVGVMRPLYFDDVKVIPKSDPSHPKSFNVLQSIQGLSFTYVADGHSGFVGLAYSPWHSWGNLSLDALVVTDPSQSGKQVYFGAIGTYTFYNKGGVSASFGAGLKGVDLVGFIFPQSNQPIVSFNVTVPLGK